MTKKISDHSLVTKLEQIPNLGPSLSNDLRLIGIKLPADLVDKDPYDLYVKLCKKTRSYHDPCVLDTFIAATRFMSGKENENWWFYTEERKSNFKKVKQQVEKYK